MNTILSSRKKNRRKTRIELPPTEHHQYDGDDDHNREGISSSRKKRGMQVARKNVHRPFRHIGDYFTLQEYIIQKDAWSLIVDDNNPLGFDMDKFDCDYTTRATPNLLPHVVIGHKLHISFGNSSFSFDTVKRAWEDCGLFETFWSNSGYTPSDFYGGKGYAGPGGKKPEQGEKKKGGPPLGFYGRAILWDNKNILLGAHYAETGRRIPVVAFLLDDNLTSVVKSQPLYLTLPDKESIAFSGRLVDLGRDGYFGYTHFYPVDETDDDEKKYGRDWDLMITSWNVKSSEDKLLQKKLQCRNGSSLMPSERTVIPVYVMHQRVILHEMKKKAGAAGFSQKRVSAVKFGGILCRIGRGPVLRTGLV
ncbi:hypothetical protein V2J09_011760 [Rumex salicifolius]